MLFLPTFVVIASIVGSSVRSLFSCPKYSLGLNQLLMSSSTAALALGMENTVTPNATSRHAATNNIRLATVCERFLRFLLTR